MAQPSIRAQYIEILKLRLAIINRRLELLNARKK